jgi:hypothetical protein
VAALIAPWTLWPESQHARVARADDITFTGIGNSGNHVYPRIESHHGAKHLAELVQTTDAFTVTKEHMGAVVKGLIKHAAEGDMLAALFVFELATLQHSGETGAAAE